MKTNDYSKAYPILHTPVLFIVFNRPETTKKVFEAIRQAKPSKLYIAADGPRANIPGEMEKCNEVRNIATAIDWNCIVKTLFRDKNLGCKNGVSRGIDWFFEHEEEGIILEDDVLPKKEFFLFCQQGLKIWKTNKAIAGIGGFVPGFFEKPFLSVHGSIWGWATWKRAWANYDQQRCMTKNDFTFLSETSSFPTLCEKLQINEFLMKNSIDTWDYYWVFSRIASRQFMILPGAPLVSNIGFFHNSGAHISGNKPEALVNAEKIKITNPVIDHSLLFKHQFEVICADYKRVYARYGWKSSLSVVKCVLNQPLLTLELFQSHLKVIIRTFLLKKDNKLI